MFFSPLIPHLHPLLEDLKMLWVSHTRPPSLFSKQSLGQRCNERHFNQQPDKRFERGDERLWVAWLKLFRKEPPSMKGGHTNDDCFIPGKMRAEQKVNQREHADDHSIGDEAPYGLVPVAGD